MDVSRCIAQLMGPGASFVGAGLVSSRDEVLTSIEAETGEGVELP